MKRPKRHCIGQSGREEASIFEKETRYVYTGEMELSSPDLARTILDLSQSGLSQDLRELRDRESELGALVNLAGYRCAELNLNEQAKRYVERRAGYYSDVKNPFLHPSETQALIENIHREFGVIWSYGGYLEDRSFIWAGSYMEHSQSFIHAGVDFNVPAGVGVVATRPLRVLLVDSDEPEVHGWGGRVIAAPVDRDEDEVVLIFAHLQAIACRTGDLVASGAIFAETGEPRVNGGWFPHLHIQAVRRDFYDKLSKSGLKELDGYFPARHMDEMARLFPDPLRYLF